MNSHELLCLAKLGDHLGLTPLCEHAAELFIKLPWETNYLHGLKSILELSLYRWDHKRLDSLLHHPQRGAFTELQVLEVLESCNTAEADIAAIVRMDRLQPAEFQTLLGILVNLQHAPGILLAKAVRQQLTPKALQQAPDWKQCIRIVDHFMQPSSDANTIELPEAELQLHFQPRVVDGKTCPTSACIELCFYPKRTLPGLLTNVQSSNFVLVTFKMLSVRLQHWACCCRQERAWRLCATC